MQLPWHSPPLSSSPILLDAGGRRVKLCSELHVLSQAFLVARSQTILSLLLLLIFMEVMGTGFRDVAALLGLMEIGVRVWRVWGLRGKGTDGWHHCKALFLYKKTAKQSSKHWENKLLWGWWSTGAGCSLHPCRCPTPHRTPSRAAFSSWLHHELRGWIRWIRRGPCHPEQRCDSVKCLLKMPRGWRTGQPVAGEQTALPTWFRISLFGYAGQKQERTNTYLYRGLQLQVKLKTQALHVTCQLPSKIFQRLFTHFNQ